MKDVEESNNNDRQYSVKKCKQKTRFEDNKVSKMIWIHATHSLFPQLFRNKLINKYVITVGYEQ